MLGFQNKKKNVQHFTPQNYVMQTNNSNVAVGTVFGNLCEKKSPNLYVGKVTTAWSVVPTNS